MASPLVSVIIPVYNAERYLQQTISSVLNQSFRDFEIIILNDGSKDSSGEIIQHLQKEDNRIIYIAKKNTGVSDTRNTGILNAKGKYLAFLDADDVWKPDNLEKKIRVLQMTGKKWIFSSMEVIDENNNLLPQTIGKLSTENILDRLLLWEEDNVIPIASSGIVAEKQLFDYGVNFDLNLSSPADRDICIQLAAKAEPALIDEILVQYRFHAENMTSTNKRVADEVIYFIRKVKKANLFSSKKVRRKSLSNLNLMLAGICYKFLGQKMRTVKYLIKSVAWSPVNVWNKKVKPAIGLYRKKAGKP